MKTSSKILSFGLACASLYYINNDQQNQKIFCKSNSFQFKYSLTMKPHPRKAHKGGEDAAYADQGVIAVADGVGGWASHGVDPAIYSNKLIKNVENLWKKDPKKYRKDPKNLLKYAALPVDVLGSSTLVICTLDGEKPQLNTAYMGDSGYIILRPSPDGQDLSLTYESKEQQKAFNFPYQLGYRQHGDHPDMAWTFKHNIQHNDIVVVGSDGLFDNMSPQQILNLIKETQPQTLNMNQDSINKLSQTITNRCYNYSLDRFYMSPFAIKAREHRKMYVGGKSDDITVVVAQILNE